MDAEAVAAVGGQFDLDQVVVEQGIFIQIFPRFEFPDAGVEDHDPLPCGRKSQFLGRTDHSIRLDTSQLSRFDFQTAGKFRADSCNGNMNPRADIRSTADDLADGRTDVDLAHVQLVGVRMAFALFHISDNDTVGSAGWTD